MASSASHQSKRPSTNDRRSAGGMSARGGGGGGRSRNLSASTNFSDKKSDDQSHVNVAVRCRPMSEKEISDGHQSIVEFEGNKRIVVHDTSESPSDQLGTKSGERRNYSHVYDFNAVFDCQANQRDVYDCVCKPIVDSVLGGYNGTIFAYGQTGTGKTYSMEGASNRRLRRESSAKQQQQQRQKSASAPNGAASQQRRSSGSTGKQVAPVDAAEPDILATKGGEESLGIIPRAFRQIFEHVASNPKVQFLIRASYLEIYQEEIHDLLRKDRSIKLELHERPDIGVYVKDLTSFVCKSIIEIERVMRVGNQNRMVGATDMNEHSSRSHAIFMITIEQQQQPDSKLITKSQHQQQQQQVGVIKVGKLNLVDLAGSERQRKTNSFGQRQRESIKINLSLSALGNVINSLMKINTQQQSNNNTYNNNNNTDGNGGNFTPYRDSKLTRLLQDSLGGNARTLMLANIGPASYNYDETINTLNYASRAKCIRNKPRLNEDPKDALLRELQREIDDLRSKLASLNHNNNNNNNIDDGNNNKSKRKKNSNYNNNNSSDTKDNTEAVDGQRVRRELIELRQKLSSLEGKLLNGVQSANGIGGQAAAAAVSMMADPSSLLQGYTYEQQLKLERSRAELAQQADREQAIRDELERREEAELMAKESFSSVQQELEAKKKLIRQILLKTQSMRNEIEATQKAYRLELDELDQLQYVLQRELKLKCLIMDNFIPNCHVDQLLARIVYDERRNSCQLIPIELALDYCNLDHDESMKFENFWQPPNGGRRGHIRPRSEFEQIAETIYPTSIRYKYDNFIGPHLELVHWDVGGRELGGPKMEEGGGGGDMSNGGDSAQLTTTKIQTLIDEALSQHESDMVI